MKLCMVVLHIKVMCPKQNSKPWTESQGHKQRFFQNPLLTIANPFQAIINFAVSKWITMTLDKVVCHIKKVCRAKIVTLGQRSRSHAMFASKSFQGDNFAVFGWTVMKT